MSSSSETGHYVNIANLNTLIQYYTAFGTAYNPSDPSLAIAALQALHTTASTQHTAINPAKQPYIAAVNVRQTQFKNMRKLATRVYNAFRVTPNIDPLLVKDLKTILDRIRGQRTSATLPETENQISVSQQSYNMLYDHFSKFEASVVAVPNYSPNETELQPANLAITRANLLTTNNSVILTTVQFKAALKARNATLYDQNGLVDKALLSKTYVASAFGKQSDQYNLIKGIRFSRPRN